MTVFFLVWVVGFSKFSIFIFGCGFAKFIFLGRIEEDGDIFWAVYFWIYVLFSSISLIKSSESTDYTFIIGANSILLGLIFEVCP